MSIDDKSEQALYDAIAAVMHVPRPKERERILKRAIELSASVLGYRIIFEENVK